MTIQEKIVWLLQKTVRLLQFKKKKMENELTNQVLTDANDKIYQTAKSLLGTEVAPINLKELGCAITIYRILEKSGFPLAVDDPTSTTSLFCALNRGLPFIRIFTPREGDIIINPTHLRSAASPLSHGHAGVILKFGIGSNDSASGLFKENYTIESWKQYFEKRGRIPTFYFRRLILY